MEDKRYIGDRLREVRKALNQTQAVFAALIKISQSNLSDYENGKVIPEERTLSDILGKLGVNRTWFESGQGNMFRAPTSLHPANNLSSKLSQFQTYFTELPERESENYVRYYDVEVTAGRVEQFFDDADEIPAGYIYAPQYRDCISCNIKGDSMYDKIFPGSRLYIYHLQNKKYIDFGQIYLIVLDGYRVLKYIVRDPKDEEYVILRSYNNHYEDWRVERKDIIHLFLVKGYETQNAI